MPCYLYSYHGHGTWMPDRRHGYVHRMRGLQPFDPSMAKAYRAQQREGAVLFEREHQLLIVRIARGADAFIDAIVHAVATEPTHAHVLISWKHDRDWKSMRTSVRSAITRALNEQFGKRSWFSDSPSRKRVHDIEHFDYLMLEYLPKHSGVQWFREADVKAARRRAAK